MIDPKLSAAFAPKVPLNKTDEKKRLKKCANNRLKELLAAHKAKTNQIA